MWWLRKSCKTTLKNCLKSLRKSCKIAYLKFFLEKSCKITYLKFFFGNSKSPPSEVRLSRGRFPRGFAVLAYHISESKASAKSEQIEKYQLEFQLNLISFSAGEGRQWYCPIQILELAYTKSQSFSTQATHSLMSAMVN